MRFPDWASALTSAVALDFGTSLGAALPVATSAKISSSVVARRLVLGSEERYLQDVNEGHLVKSQDCPKDHSTNMLPAVKKRLGNVAPPRRLGGERLAPPRDIVLEIDPAYTSGALRLELTWLLEPKWLP
mmetsp:Transcript_44797/g.81729  ORF Transcript_44797/g.81729 Transcript_44797/m.81729 type:complete len:130 (+) Transcript_44797:293-682(+)